jgi:pyrroloquinoline quinone (PQQ) biosynthesis protein C
MTTLAEQPHTTPIVPASRIVNELKAGIADLLRELEREPAWQALMNPATPAEVSRATMREIYAEIAMYQPDIIEAAIAAIGQFPRSVPAKKIRAMLVHQAEEWDHGEMAIRDFIGLGSSEHIVRQDRWTPTAFAAASVWRMFVHKRMPFAYLGALYLFEGLTPIVTGQIKPFLERAGLGQESLEFVQFHSTEDIRHTRLVDAVIRDIAVQFPDATPQIQFGFDMFRHVYPLPGWRAAYERATAGRR